MATWAAQSADAPFQPDVRLSMSVAFADHLLKAHKPGKRPRTSTKPLRGSSQKRRTTNGVQAQAGTLSAGNGNAPCTNGGGATTTPATAGLKGFISLYRVVPQIQ